MSLWSAISGVGKLAAPFIPVIGPAIGAGLGLADAIKGPSKAQGATQTGLENNINTAETMNKDLTKSSADTFQAGRDKANTSGSYFSSLLGSRSAALQATEPEVSTIMDQFDAAHKAAAEFSPRGGGRATLNAEQPYKAAGVIGKLLASSRNNAASVLANLGINEEGLGVQQSGQAISALNAGTSAANALGENEAAYQKMKSKEYGDIGSGLGNVLGKVIANRKKGSSGSGYNLDASTLDSSGDVGF